MSYSSQFLDSSSSGIISIIVPQYDGDDVTVKGILQDDLKIVMGNNWSPLQEINTALDPLQDVQQIWQANSISNYVAASGMAWKGTAPISVQASFYLINFNATSNAEASAKLLAQLCTINTTGSTSASFHAGYKLDYLSDNNTLSSNVDTKLDKKGTVTVCSDTNTKIYGLLCKTFACNPSTVCVANGQPLYYSINMDFTGYRAPIMEDVNSIFGG